MVDEPELINERKHRGKLKVYLGMSAGVGKTFAMLSDALVELQQGKRVLAGYIEPHSRPATENLASQVPQLPTRVVEYKGLSLREFDLDAALEVRPEILLVDELAHSNAVGSRHAKRWQDIDELISQGITVWTTVNIQHIESLRDIVTQVTGVDVLEAVPDSFFAKVDDFELVDIPPDELLKRLESGKIYAAEKVDTALRNFFRKENLIALREIALRHTANAVDVQLRNFKTADRDATSYGTSPRVLISIGPSKFAPRLVRAGVRLASHLKAPFIVMYVETPRTLGIAEIDQAYAQKAMSMAERLGGEIVRSSGSDIVGELLKLATQRKATIIVIGKPHRGRLSRIFVRSIVDDLIQRSGDIAVHVVHGEKDEASAIPIIVRAQGVTFKSFSKALLALGLTLVAASLADAFFFDPTNLAMLFILPVAWTAARVGRTEATVAAILGVLLFDFLFVPPRGSFSVTDIQYLVTFSVMFSISLLISTLTLQLRSQAEASSGRERRTSLLLGMSRRLAETRSLEDVAGISREILADVFDSEVVIFWPAEDGRLKALNRTIVSIEEDPQEIAVAQWVSTRKTQAGKGTDTLPAAKGYYAPLDSRKLQTPVLALYRPKGVFSAVDIDLVDGFAYLISSAMTRVESQNEATDAQIQAKDEQLRNILLSSVSHDLRTPLTTITGAAKVIEARADVPPEVKALASSITDSSEHLNLIVRNVLDLTRLEAGKVHLRRDWHTLEELLGTALRRTDSIMAPRRCLIELPDDLPLLYVDGILIEQVFVNLLENVARHTPAATTLTISAQTSGSNLDVEFVDDGPGLKDPKGAFEKLVKGEHSQGFGLGLAVCAAAMRVHDGDITAQNRLPHGSIFSLTFPLEAQPEELTDEH